MASPVTQRDLDRAEEWFASNIKRARAVGKFCEIAEITPAVAELLLLKNIGNRPIVLTGVRHWAEALKAGDWEAVNGETIKIAISGELNDGQHRLKAIVETGISITTFVAWGLSRESRMTVDLHKKRTVAHVLGMNDVKNSNLVAAVAKIHLNIRRETALRYNCSAKEVKREIDDYIDLVEYRGPPVKAANTFRQSPSLFYTIHCIASRWHTPQDPFGLSPQRGNGPILDPLQNVCWDRYRKADEFFSYVDSCVGITDKQHPSSVLHRRLQANSTAKAKLPLVEVAALVIKAWNAFIRDEGITMLRWNGVGEKQEPFPKVL